METTFAFKSPEGKKEVLKYYDMLLEKLSVPYERITVSTRYGDTFIIAAGNIDAPPLILLHGSSMNSAMWIDDIQKFSDSFRVYAPDMPGEPGRSSEIQLPFDTHDYDNWLNDVFDSLSVDRAVLIGASLGAWLAAKFSVSHQEKVAKLVLLCPAGIGSQKDEFKSIAFSLISKGESGLNELFIKINGDNPIPEAILNYHKLIAINFNARQEKIPLFSDEELKLLTMPSFLFVGAKDIMLNSDETAKRYKSLIPSAKIVVLPEKGHSLSGLADEIKHCFSESYTMQVTL